MKISCDKGSAIVTGVRTPTVTGYENVYWLEPAVFVNATPEMRAE